MALSSMTGFGRASGQISDRWSASLVVRSVNHRFLDVQVRTSIREEIPELEATVRAVVAEPLERGRVTVHVDLERTGSRASRISVERAAVSDILDQLSGIDLPDDVDRTLSLRDVLSIPGVVSVASERTVLEDSETTELQEIARAAVGQLVAMRRQEGALLAAQLSDELVDLEVFLDWFEPQMVTFREGIVERLRERVERLLGPTIEVDPERVVQEAALLADRSEVAEEVVRLRSHIQNFRARLEEGGAIGRALDFLCQEIHRELNTLGSKCREAGVAERLVEAKTVTERLREQVQNLE
jgi:uncharacterized protein (TIGR00255 family)